MVQCMTERPDSTHEHFVLPNFNGSSFSLCYPSRSVFVTLVLLAIGQTLKF